MKFYIKIVSIKLENVLINIIMKIFLKKSNFFAKNI